MSSERRINASRENGAKSRGPKTPAGKRCASKNSQRHGMLAQTIVLDEEDADAFEELIVSLEMEFGPRSPNENALVENLAVSRWRLMRVWAIEKEDLRLEMKKRASTVSNPVSRATLAFHGLSDDSRFLDTLHRYETRYDRQYSRALNMFYKSRDRSNLPLEPSPKSGTESGTGLPACVIPEPPCTP